MFVIYTMHVLSCWCRFLFFNDVARILYFVTSFSSVG